MKDVNKIRESKRKKMSPERKAFYITLCIVIILILGALGYTFMPSLMEHIVSIIIGLLAIGLLFGIIYLFIYDMLI